MTVEGASLRPALLVAWPHADRARLWPMVDAGLLPTLSHLIDSGASGPLVPAPPPAPIASWACLITGCWAHRHGILHAQEIDARGDVREASLDARRVPAIWDAVQSTGRSVEVIGWNREALDDPPHPVSTLGIETVIRRMVSDPSQADACHAALMARLRSAIAESIHSAEQARRALRECALVAVRFRGLGVLAREFARFDPPAPDWVLPERARLFANVFLEAWRMHDEILRTLIDASGRDRIVMLASESGLDPEALRSPPGAEVPRAMRPGLIVVAGPGIRRDAMLHGGMVPAACATLMRAMGLETSGMDAAPIAGAFESDSPDVPALSTAGSAAVAPTGTVVACVSPPGASAEARVALHERACNLARSLMLQGCWRQAHDALEMADGEPGIDALDLRVRCLVAERRIPEARRQIDRWHVLEPTASARLDSLEAALRLHEGRPEGAHQRLREAFGRHGEQPELLVDLAEVLLHLNREPEATAACRRAIELDHGLHVAHAMLSRCHHQASRFDEAAEAAQRAIVIRFMDPEMHFLRGTALAAAGRPDEAVQALLEAVRQRPDFPAAYRRLAAVHLRQLGRHGAAEGFMQAATMAEQRLRARRKVQ